MVRNRKRTILTEIEDLYLSIYTVGYTSEGESCVLVLYSNTPDKRVFYSIVIDCYEEEECNYTLEILESLKEISPKLKLDMLIWTHPHDDHSLGIDKIIKKYCNNNTKIITSQILNTPDIYSPSCNNIKNQIGKINYRRKIRWNISQSEAMGNILDEISFENAGDLISQMKIKCIAPCTDIICKEINDEEINKLSIGIFVEIKNKKGEINLLFTGDLENQTIREIINERVNEDIPSVYHYIKLPHHGGHSGENLVKLLDPKMRSKFGVSTVFKKTIRSGVMSNPNEDVLKNYKNYIDEVACTADVFNGSYGIGIIKIIYDLKDQHFDILQAGAAKRNIV